MPMKDMVVTDAMFKDYIDTTPHIKGVGGVSTELSGVRGGRVLQHSKNRVGKEKRASRDSVLSVRRLPKNRKRVVTKKSVDGY